MIKHHLMSAAAVFALLTGSAALAQPTTTLFTSFEPSEGIAPGATSISLGGGLVTFSDADGIAGPGSDGGIPVETKDVSDEAADFALDGATPTVSGDFILAVNGASGPTVLDIDFAFGATEVSFSAFNDANGQARIQVFDLAGDLLTEETVTNSTGFNGEDDFFSFSAADFGVELIGSIDFLNNVPAANPNYIAYIDDFTATVAVPEPASLALVGMALVAGLARRSRQG